jgi:hypothetical protein
MYGRKINDDLRPGTAYHLYLPGPHRGIFNLEALAESKEIVLCEALIDALTFWCARPHDRAASPTPAREENNDASRRADRVHRRHARRYRAGE